MKLKYKKLVIIITVVTLAISFFILTMIPTGGSDPNSAENANIALNENQDINKLMADYFAAKKTVDVEAMSTLVSDPNRIDERKFIALAEYVEDYQNINCYVIENKETSGYRVYVKYDMKLKNIETLAPCLSAFYVTLTSDGKYVVYLSALDSAQQDFINSANKNEEIEKLIKEVEKELQSAIDKDAAFKQLYQKMDSQIQAASGAATTAQ